MRDAARFPALAVLILPALYACSAESPSGPRPADLQLQSAVAGTCDLIPGVASDAAAYFPSVDRYDIVEVLIGDMQSACGAGTRSQVASDGWQILEVVEQALEADEGGDPTIGGRLVASLLACTGSLCESTAVPAINFHDALSINGLFAVRRTGLQPAVARGSVPFIDFDGMANSALWGVEVDLPWSQVTGTNPVLVFGQPGPPTLPLKDVGIGGLEYDMNVYPDAGEFLDGALHVSVCFRSQITLPLVAGLDGGPRMQREGVLLEDHQPVFCPPASSAQNASLLAPLASIARRILPAPVSRLLFVTRVGVIGGTPLDFSRFSPVAANTSGYLEFVQEPDPVVTENQPIGTILVRARSGAGTPMEKVLVTLTLVTNNGVPAGAVLSGDIASLTQERNGEEGIAAFPDDAAPPSVGKPGAYRLCATGQLNGYTFPQICSERFHARNGK